jgi:preprotein translocase subunit SecB
MYREGVPTHGVISYELSQIRLTKSVFFPNPGYSPPAPGQPVALSLSLENQGTFNQDGTMVEFVQAFQTAGGVDLPFSLEVEFLAVFTLSGAVPNEDRENLIQRLFPQVVFPFTREYIAEVTRRGGFPPLVLNPSFGSGSGGGGGGDAEQGPRPDRQVN